MSMRGGGAVAFDYLRTLSSTFQLEPNSLPASSKVGGFAFNVILPDDTPTPSLKTVK